MLTLSMSAREKVEASQMVSGEASTCPAVPSITAHVQLAGTQGRRRNSVRGFRIHVMPGGKKHILGGDKVHVHEMLSLSEEGTEWAVALLVPINMI